MTVPKYAGWYAAFVSREPRDANPHPVGSAWRAEWDSGWSEGHADRELADARRALSQIK